MPENGLSERFDRIEKRVDALSADMTARFGKVDERFEQVDKRFNQINQVIDAQSRPKAPIRRQSRPSKRRR
jgi:tetrahydromethanopterin S-methyltransferase subunit G